MSVVCLSVSVVGGVLLVFMTVFGLLSLGFIPGGSSNSQGRFLFSFKGSFLFFFFFLKFLLHRPQVDPFFYSIFFICL